MCVCVFMHLCFFSFLSLSLSPDVSIWKLTSLHEIGVWSTDSKVLNILKKLRSFSQNISEKKEMSPQLKKKTHYFPNCLIL